MPASINSLLIYLLMYALAKLIVGNSRVGSLKLTIFRNPDILRQFDRSTCHARVCVVQECSW